MLMFLSFSSSVNCTGPLRSLPLPILSLASHNLFTKPLLNFIFTRHSFRPGISISTHFFLFTSSFSLKILISPTVRHPACWPCWTLHHNQPYLHSSGICLTPLVWIPQAGFRILISPRGFWFRSHSSIISLSLSLLHKFPPVARHLSADSCAFKYCGVRPHHQRDWDSLFLGRSTRLTVDKKRF